MKNIIFEVNVSVYISCLVLVGGSGEVHSSADRITEISQCMTMYILHCVAHNVLFVLCNMLIVPSASLSLLKLS